jgi:hypothetical protein
LGNVRDTRSARRAKKKTPRAAPDTRGGIDHARAQFSKELARIAHLRGEEALRALLQLALQLPETEEGDNGTLPEAAS